MNPERWQKIKRIYQSALEVETAGREIFLRDKCADDEALLQEVRSLLNQDSQSPLDSPALDGAARVLAQEQSSKAQPNLVGQALHHYRIQEKIGAGGMGVVYRARDEHLKRDIAIKVLPPELVADTERKKRFVQEARAASALNHPNIVTIYDVTSEDGIDFIAMELVTGKTLDQKIGRKGMKLSDALKYAIQIADALSAAHAAGIVHRDLKPANILVTESGQVKVLDFGLAKLTQPLNGERADSSSAALSTEEGRIMGTSAYMSPEQAEGKAVDARSDIFSFGSVLYELVTGRRAFQGNSVVSIVAEILKSEPTPLNAGIPHDLEMIISRCLRKDSARRYQHIGDVKVALEDLKEESDSSIRAIGASSVPAARRWWRIYAPAAVLLILAVAAALYYYRSESKKEMPLTVIPLTTYPGFQSAPSFSPDGSQVAFSWNGEKQDNFDIYVKLVSGGPPLRLTTEPQPDVSPVWSPDGSHIAFVRDGFVYLISALGGPERKLSRGSTQVEWVQRSVLAWTPDGKSLAVVDRDSDTSPRAIYLVSIATGERQRLTSPQTGRFGGDLECAFSPDGKSLAFTHMPSFITHEIFILPLVNSAPNGEPWRLTDDRQIVNGLVWTPDSREVVFSSDRGGRRSLWRISASRGAQTRRVPGTEDAVCPVVSRGPTARLAYQRLVYEVNIWHKEISPSEKTANPAAQIITSTRVQRDPQFSPDGRRIAFTSDRSGSPEIWVSDSAGSNSVQLTAFAGSRTAGAPRWSPDGRQIAFDSGAGSSFSIFTISAEGGAPRQLITDPSYCIRPSWSRDGRWVYFGSNWPGIAQIWKVPPEGGKAVQVTRNGGLEAIESPDGKMLYFIKEFNVPGIMSMPVDGGAESLVIPSAQMGHWAVADKGIWHLDFEARSGNSPVPLKFFSFETHQVSQLGFIEKIGLTNDASFSVTRDSRHAIWRQTDRNESDLMLIDNFR